MRLSDLVELLEAGDLDDLRETAEDPYVLKAVFMAGAGGSGKSHVAKAMFGGTGLRYLNQDTHLERFMKEAGEPLDRVGQRYDLFKKAQNLRKKEFAHYAKRRAGIIIDVTGWDKKRVINPLNKLRALGYDAMMVFVRTTLETARRRNKDRERVVPQSYIDTAHAGSLKNLPAFRNSFGPSNFVLVDNDVDIPQKDWAKGVQPTLHKIAMEFLSRPVKNPKGKQWLAKMGNPPPITTSPDDDGAINLAALSNKSPRRPKRESVRVTLPATLLG